jgi:hypothetical protein
VSIEHLDALARLLPAIERGSFDAGQWAGGDPLPDGSISFPWFAWGEGIKAFVHACGPLMLRGFDWGTWQRSEESQRVFEHLETASEQELRQIITTIVRQERFVEGMLAGYYRDGLLKRLCERARDLVHRMWAEPSYAREPVECWRQGDWIVMLGEIPEAQVIAYRAVWVKVFRPGHTEHRAAFCSATVARAWAREKLRSA